VSGTVLVTRASLGGLSPVIAPVPMTQLPTRVWSQRQWELIKRGYRAQDMDEKWDVFVENHVAFLHRSWTGNGVFEVTFSPAGGGWRMSGAVVGSSRARTVSAKLNRVLLELVLCAIVLGEPAVRLRAELVRLSWPSEGPAPPQGVIEHSALGLRSDRSAGHRTRAPHGQPETGKPGRTRPQ
jgi:hypothetical protein